MGKYIIVVKFYVDADSDIDAKKKVEKVRTQGLTGEIDKIVRLDDY